MPEDLQVILDKIDSIREKHRQALTTLLELRESVITARCDTPSVVEISEAVECVVCGKQICVSGKFLKRPTRVLQFVEYATDLAYYRHMNCAESA